jgi:hypothetical protein
MTLQVRDRDKVMEPYRHRDCQWMNLFEAACGPPRARAA